jgi:hypothetical protein
MTPTWLLDVAAALMLAVAAVSMARLVAARPWRRGAVVFDTDVAHLLMAIAMAGMLAPALRKLPDTAWEVIFGALAAWFAVRVARDAWTNGMRALADGHCAPHLVHSCSMIYMFLAMTAAASGAGGMSGPGGMPDGAGPDAMTLRYPTLALLFAFVLVGYAVWDLDQLSGRRYNLRIPRVSLGGITARGIPVPGRPVLAGAESETLALPDPGTPHGSMPPRGSAPPPGPPPEAVDLAARQSEDTARKKAGVGEWGSGFLLSPAVTIGCRIAMGVTMAFMLFVAI